MPKRSRYAKCFDPYLRYAISTHFRYFDLFRESDGFKLFFLVKFKPPGKETGNDPAAGFKREMEAANFRIEFGPIPANSSTRYRTLRAQRTAVTRPSAIKIWDKYVSRVELSLPLKPLPPPKKLQLMMTFERWNKGKTPPGPLLIGMLDDGCPFAAAQFLRASAPPSTRVRAIWDQDQDRQPADHNGDSFGQKLPDFKYGLEYWRDFKTPVPQQIGIDDWMKAYLTPAGSIDEDACYADADFRRLKFRESHGAHVMDVLAGSVPTSSRIGPTQSGTDHRDPPSWAPGTDPASKADVVFVQFPKNGIDDSTGVWLKAYVLDGIRYILSFADPNVTKHVIINLSYGPTTGPHDGAAVLEAALSELVTDFSGTLQIFLPVGNSYLTEGHVSFEGGTGQLSTIEWTWRLLPDNPVLCFAEVWMDATQATTVAVTLTPPDGGGGATINPIPWGNNWMWRLEVDPTITGPNAAPHGDYTIKVSGIPQGAQVDAYVARTDPNMDVQTGAKRSYFVDPAWEQTRAAAAGCTYVNGEFDKTGSLISRYGTLNGIATALDPSVHVASGDMLSNGRKSPYASAGPARGHPNPNRIGPDYAMFCDESYALEGVRAGGTRSGAVFRLIGTSAAAPQLARLIADAATLSPTKIPPPGRNPEREQRGGGNLDPP